MNGIRFSCQEGMSILIQIDIVDYDNLSIKEIDILKERTSFLVTQAEININDLMWLIEHRKKIEKVIMYYERWKIFNNL